MNTFGRILNRNGTDASLSDSGGEHSVKVFLVPEKMSFGDESRILRGSMGVSDESRYLLFFSGDFTFMGCSETVLQCGGHSYEFINCELFKVNGKASHYEALVKLREEMAV